MNLKDYIHFYLGCEVLVTLPFDPDNPTVETLQGVSQNGFFTTSKGRIGFQDIKPILRRLSNMKENEITPFNELNPYLTTNGMCNPEQFKFLLSKNFDLFGLIDAGLAIDATKLTK